VWLGGVGGSFYHPAATALIARLFPATTGRALVWRAWARAPGFFFGRFIPAGGRSTGDWRYPWWKSRGSMIFAGRVLLLAEEEAAVEATDNGNRRRTDRKAVSHERVGNFLFMACAFSLRDLPVPR